MGESVKYMKNKKICILGAAGYIGVELCKTFAHSLNKVIAIDSNFIPWQPKFFREMDIEFFHRDIFNTADLIKDADIVYNLVSITLVPQVKSQETPEKSAEIHRVGTEGNRYVIQNVKKDCKIIFPSSHVIWEGLTDSIEVDEKYPACPVLSYSMSKYQSELDISKSGNPFTIARLSSVYGYNEACRWRILPNLFSKMAANNQTLKVFGGANIKPICGIKDVARALNMFSYLDTDGEIYNVVNECTTVMDIALMCQKIKPSIKIEETSDEVPNKGYFVSNSKLLSAGFRFSQNIETEIAKMISNWNNWSGQ